MSQIRQQDAEVLRKGYNPSIRAMELFSIVSFFALVGTLAWKVAPLVPVHGWLILTAVVMGYVASDFTSGFVHWLGDTWGSPQMPVIGQGLIRPFREHHVDQEAITRHDFIETNGANCFISLPVGLISVLLPIAESRSMLFLATFLGALIFWTLMTNQFHKWAHLPNPPGWISVLQRLHLILPPAHHAIHHRAPYAKYYCITVGWLNWPLAKLGVFGALERLVTRATGLLPRADDIGAEAAERVARALAVDAEPASVAATAPAGAREPA